MKGTRVSPRKSKSKELQPEQPSSVPSSPPVYLPASAPASPRGPDSPSSLVHEPTPPPATVSEIRRVQEKSGSY